MALQFDRYRDDLEHDIVGGCPHDVFFISPKAIDLSSLYLQVNRAGIVLRTPADFTIRRDDSYRFNVLHCVLSGRGRVSFRGIEYAPAKGSLFLLPAGEAHAYAADPSDPFGLVWVEFGGANSTELVRHVVDRGGPLFSGSIFRDIVELCTSVLYQPSQLDPKNSAILYQILMCLCSRLEDQAVKEYIDREILTFIDENLGRKLTLTETARHFGYHPAYFSARFTRTMGINFSRYLNDRRMRRACYLLMTTNWSVDRIAHALAYYDVSHFIRRFKASEGTTPLRYRRATQFRSQKEAVNDTQGGSP
jgi:AraC-like DNA-binding protein